MTSRNVGEILKSKRLKAKLSLKELVTLTKIKREYLEALEAGRWQKLPDPAFVKGYVIAYSQALGLDPKQMLAFLRRDYRRSEAPTALSFLTGRRRRTFGWWTPLVVGLVLATVIYLSTQWYLTNKPPTLVVYTPRDQTHITEKKLMVRGQTEPTATLEVNGHPVALSVDGEFETEVEFPVDGLVAIVVSATDQQGRKSELVRYVYVQPESH